MRLWIVLWCVSGLMLLTGATCGTGGEATPIPAGSYVGSIGGTSELTDQSGAVLENGSSQSDLTLVVDSTGKPISLNVETSANAPSQTLTVFTVGQSQRFQYSYNDPTDGQVTVDYTARVIQSGYGSTGYILEYEFTGSQTTVFGVTSMFGKNEYKLYNQNDVAVWVIRTQSSTLTPPGGQGLYYSTLLETGLLAKSS